MRYKNIDLLKAVAMLFVVSLHAGTWHPDLVAGGAVGCMQYALRILAEGVPLFVAVNGFLVLGKREFSLRKHLGKTLRIFLQLVFWSVFLVVVKALIWGDTLTVNLVIENAFPATVIGNKYTGPLWFLRSLIALYLVVPLLKYAYDNCKSLFCYLYWMSLGAWCVVLLAGYVADPFGKATGLTVFGDVLGWVKGFMPATATSFVLFFMTGGMVRHYHIWIAERRRLLVGLGVVAWVAAFAYALAMSHVTGDTYPPSFNSSSPFMFAMLLAWFAATDGYVGRVCAIDCVVSSVGRSTMGIYLLHTIVIAALGGLVSISSLVFPLRLVFLLVVFAISWLSTLLLQGIPMVRELF